MSVKDIIKEIELQKQLTASKTKNPYEDTEDFDNFFNAYKPPKDLEQMIIDSSPILGKFILKGQLSFIYGPPNSGKTLIIMSLLKDVEESVIYLNADDGINNGTEKVQLAVENNYTMVLCGTDNNNDPKTILLNIEKELKDNSEYYKHKIIIFDTVKKFVDPLNKKSSATFLQLMRKITLSGGTVILLGHTNKHRDAGDKLIFEGVGDWVSDMDCVYSLDYEYNDMTKEKVVILENQKSRGVVPETVSYKYDASKDIENVRERIKTVTPVAKDDAEYVKDQARLREQEKKYEDSLLFIVTMLKKHGKLTQTDIRNYAKEDKDFCGSDSEIRKCLNAFEDYKWVAKTSPIKNNAKEYMLKN